MARIAVDMDEVIADTLAEHLRRYNADFKKSLTKADLDGRWLWQVVPTKHHPALLGYLDEPNFFGTLPVMADAQRVLRRLSRDHEVYIASAAMEVPKSFNAKYRWMQEYFPFIEPARMVFCGEKSIIAADYLIDDNPRQLRAFRGEGLLFTAPHNTGVTDWVRVDDWLAVERLFYPASAGIEHAEAGSQRG